MKSIFDKTTRDQVITRINSLSENSSAQWGKMNVYQMVKHCAIWEEMIQGKQKYKRVFIGRIIGKILLKIVLKDDAPLRRGTPTVPGLEIRETAGDLVAEKAKWINNVELYAKFANPNYIHVFFGKMTEEQIGYFVYKHIDHHLRQFNS